MEIRTWGNFACNTLSIATLAQHEHDICNGRIFSLFRIAVGDGGDDFDSINLT